MLLNSQRNKLFQILTDNGLQPSDFKESKYNDSYRIDLKEQPSSFYFHVMRLKKDGVDAYQVTKRPGLRESPDTRSLSVQKSWDSTSDYCSTDEFISWASAVKLELEIPDLWEENIKALQLFTSDHELVAERFSISELGAVQGQLRMLIQNFDASDLPDTAKVKLVNIARTALLKAETFTKKDWQNWIAGAFANTVSSLELDEKQTQGVIALVRQAFGGLFLQD